MIARLFLRRISVMIIFVSLVGSTLLSADAPPHTVGRNAPPHTIG